MDRRNLYRECDRQVKILERAVTIPRPFVLDVFIARIAAWRGRRIELLPYAHLTGECGLWLEYPDFDVIAYARTSPLHEEHIILHELAHMICDHKGASLLSSESIQAFTPRLSPKLVNRILGRASYPDAEEQEAELIATLIMKRVADNRPHNLTSSTPDLVSELGRLLSTFEG